MDIKWTRYRLDLAPRRVDAHVRLVVERKREECSRDVAIDRRGQVRGVVDRGSVAADDIVERDGVGVARAPTVDEALTDVERHERGSVAARLLRGPCARYEVVEHARIADLVVTNVGHQHIGRHVVAARDEAVALLALDGHLTRPDRDT